MVAFSDLLFKPSVRRTGKSLDFNSELSGVSHGKRRVRVSLLFGRGGRHNCNAGVVVGGFDEVQVLGGSVVNCS